MVRHCDCSVQMCNSSRNVGCALVQRKLFGHDPKNRNLFAHQFDLAKFFKFIHEFELNWIRLHDIVVKWMFGLSTQRPVYLIQVIAASSLHFPCQFTSVIILVYFPWHLWQCPSMYPWNACFICVHCNMFLGVYFCSDTIPLYIGYNAYNI